MKEEMLLVQNMEGAADRDSDAYIENLEELLNVKSDAVLALRAKVKRFQDFRRVNY